MNDNKPKRQTNMSKFVQSLTPEQRALLTPCVDFCMEVSGSGEAFLQGLNRRLKGDL